MKYKVIGWTYYDNSDILTSNDPIGFAERSAIIDEIRKHGYLFSGWHHQESWRGVVPILNDGKKRCFSQRGWGGIMAEAYGCTEDYDYAVFSFQQSVADTELRFPPDNFNIYAYTPEIIENEHFCVEVSEGVLEMARQSNPFYLEDTENLRYIDENDSITLCHKGERLTFIVKDVKRSKTVNESHGADSIIKSEYTIMLTHKPSAEGRNKGIPIIITGSNALTMLKEALAEYNYPVIEELFNCYDPDYLSDALPCEGDRSSLTEFVKEYINNSYRAVNVIYILQYLDNFQLYEEIAESLLESDRSIYISFINYYLDKGIDMEYRIFKFIGGLKAGEKLSYDCIDILLTAICISPHNKSLRRKYYSAIRHTSYEGLPIMAGADLFKYLRKEDRCYIEPQKYTEYDEGKILKAVEYLTYPCRLINKESYPSSLPKIYETDKKVIIDGIKAYQKYISEHFHKEAIIKDMSLCGIDKKCFEMERRLFGIEDAAKYVCSLDMLTDFRYKLKEYALSKYSHVCKGFSEEIESVYKRCCAK